MRLTAPLQGDMRLSHYACQDDSTDVTIERSRLPQAAVTSPMSHAKLALRASR
jgi:hypothetical protein